MFWFVHVSLQDVKMGQLRGSIALMFVVCEALIREAHTAPLSDLTGHRVSQRHLLIEEDNPASNSTLKQSE